MKTDTTLRLGRRQYRDYARQAKESGSYLDIATYRELGNNWGMFNRMARSVFIDASCDVVRYDEIAGITLAASVKTESFRGAIRPELDWSALEDYEIYPFILQHEIGHRVDNFETYATSDIENTQIRKRCERWMTMVNEVLADRYAWNVIRPGEPLPLSEHGKEIEQHVSECLFLIESFVPKKKVFKGQRGTGQYENVTEWMLTTNERMEFVGSKVSQAAVRRSRERELRTRERLGYKRVPGTPALVPF
ncbi:hypothetical protein JVX91_03010 [Pseudomonas sp. PDNC002]|uniref:hypothetical protein n=1 Tax=Pseudomonas sp. PDNC002 TaxID=2811422 RepID=UPI001962FFDF|nr:hypothetical protein [Pseudomonas sp. PDNC002]QRY80107.1 hypothetical protein JVX91_03010 [Pseudomonas sp. PDNC002]